MKEARQIVHTVLVTEKGTKLSETENKYVFKVHPGANKLEIKKAVEELFSVRVRKVNTMIRPGKRKRERTMHYGSTPSWKRAVVTLSEGYTIELT